VSVDPRPRILSGVQPSGKLHLGNYFGAIQQHIALQDQGEAFYFIADYHALTTLPDVTSKERRVRGMAEAVKDQHVKQHGKGFDEVDLAGRIQNRLHKAPHELLQESIRDVALDYLALGLDPTKATFYRQSDIPEVCELAWVLATVTGMGLLERAHSYKDKVENKITPSVGLFTYPILMAADILIVRSHLVPVGKDQVQHLEMTRDMAGYFNNAYGEVFPMPAERLGVTTIVPGTDGRKMSKSYGNTIDIFAEGKLLENAVMGIKTDSTPVDAPKNPETCNVFALYKLVATVHETLYMDKVYREPMYDAENRGGKPFGYGHAKKKLLTKLDEYFAPARERRKALERDPGRVEEVLRAGAKKAREVARTTLRLVRQRVGMLPESVG
jgi:tryptophanyl-tRNA synthetase